MFANLIQTQMMAQQMAMFQEMMNNKKKVKILHVIFFFLFRTVT